MRLLVRYVVVALAMMISALSANAVSAYPGLIDFKQPDGQIIQIHLYGDESLHWAATEDEYTLLYDDEGYLVYAETEQATGDLKPSKMRPAPKASMRTLHEKEFLKGLNKKLHFSDTQIEMANQLKVQIKDKFNKAPSRVSSNKSVTGEKKIVMILVEFQDVHFQRTKEDFEKLMNQLNYSDGESHGSVRDFYLENSFGKLDVITDIFGIYQVSNPRAYYGKKDARYGNDANPWAMAYEAVKLADKEANFSKYDNDGDGVVDGIHIIFAGPGEEAGGGGDCIWSHSSYMDYIELDGVTFGRYSCSPEIRGAGGNDITYIGVICHELGHVFGAMDFYDTDYQTNGYYNGTGSWDLMANGNWNGGGACPAHFNPYSKIYDFGWAEPMNGNVSSSFKLQAKSDNGFVRIDTKTDNEYFLVEYRNQKGFDTCLPGHGLMIYRKGDKLEYEAKYNTINSREPQQFYPLCANATEAFDYGNPYSSSASFPGTMNITEISDYSNPSMMSRIEMPTVKPITAIAEDSDCEYVTFDVAGGGEAIAYSLKIDDATMSSISLSWKMQSDKRVMLVSSNIGEICRPTTNTDYSDGTLIGNSTVIYSGTGTTYTHTGLLEGEKYYYTLFTKKSDGTWTPSGQVWTKTGLEVIRRFPFVEDFESQEIGSAWQTEIIYPNSIGWIIDALYEGLSDIPYWILGVDPGPYGAERQKVRMIMPTIDFTGVDKAVLSFDYVNDLESLVVEYRTSPEDEWHLLEILDGPPYWNTHQCYPHVISDIRKKNIDIPNLTSTYQISFLAEYVIGQHVVLDNISIYADDYAFVSTGDARVVARNENSCDIKVNYNLYYGNTIPTKSGIEYTTVHPNTYMGEIKWVTVYGDNQKESYATVSNYPNNKLDLYYRAFIEDAEGNRIYDHWKRFANLAARLTEGSGTETDPYLIRNADDYNRVHDFINDWIECEGLYFSIEEDFYLPDYWDNWSRFSGVIMGNNHTITCENSYLFNTLTEKGRISDLTIIKSDVGLCYRNYGIIENCTMICEGILEGYSNCHKDGGICMYNQGSIIGCHTEFEMKHEWMECGGIAKDNSGTISNCSFSGSISANNNSYIGGITGMNSGHIINCENNGTLEVFVGENTPYLSFVGGICGNSDGIIEECVNNGQIIADYGEGEESSGSLYAVYTGGVVGRNAYSGRVKNCVNYGKSEITRTNENEKIHAFGGIAGYCYLGTVENCVDCGELTVIGTESEMFQAIVGRTNSCALNNIFYCGNTKDVHATEITDKKSAVERLNTNGVSSWILDDQGNIALSGFVNDCHLSPYLITNFSATEIRVPWIVWGTNLQSWSLEWRKSGENKWNTVESSQLKNETVISGLSPVTIYDIRLKGVTKNGKILYSPIEQVATFFTSTGKVEDPHLISTYDDMLAFSTMVAHGESFFMQCVRMSADIDFGGDKENLWEPMISKYGDYFSGEFDGNGHIIYNMTIRTNVPYVGLFGKSDGYIHDLTLRNANITCLDAEAVSDTYLGGTGVYLPGVGGIVGSCESGYTEYVIERCGFEGQISVYGMKYVGSILGSGTLATTIETKYCYVLNDCYANAKIKSFIDTDNVVIGGLVGCGSAVNSYFTGSISSEPTATYISPISPLAPSQNFTTNSYYNSSYNGKKYRDLGIPIDSEIMKTQEFIDKLTPDIWVLGGQLNEGYPIFANSAQAKANTAGAKHDEQGDVVLYGLYSLGAEGDYDIFGFEYFNNSTEQLVLHNVEATIDDNNFSSIISNAQVPKSGINYRAYATNAACDTIFGEWTRFYPMVIGPKALLFSAKGNGSTITVEYMVDPGSFEVKKAMLVLSPVGGGETIEEEFDCSSPNYTSKVNGEVGDKFDVYIVFTFSNGTEIITESMSFEIGAYILGDADGSGTVSVTDAVVTVNYILGGNPEPFILEAADVDGQNGITVSDVVGIVNIVLNDTDTNKAPARTADGENNYLELEADGTNSLSLGLCNEASLTAMQFDMTLPAGVELRDVCLGGRSNGHSLAWRRMENGVYRVILFSAENRLFDGNSGEVLSLDIEVKDPEAIGNGQVSISHALAAALGMREYRLPDCSVSLYDMSGISGIAAEEDAVVTTLSGLVVYRGRLSDFHPSQPGTFLITTQRGTIKKFLK